MGEEALAMPIHDWTRVDAGIFHHFHLEWISAIQRALNSGILPAGYYALAEQIAGGPQPDVLALERIVPADGNGSATGRSPSGGVALAEAPPNVRFAAAAPAEKYTLKQRQVSIRHVSDDRVVALVEILSPGNKDRTDSLRMFVEKAVHFLDAGIHLLILDLFPPTSRDPEGIHRSIWSHVMTDQFQRPSDEPLTAAAYVGGLVKRAFVESLAVGRPLPDMPLFLEPELYVIVPLEGTYQTAYGGVPSRWQEVLNSQ
jgi:hypothetical protein